jgi:hypothetical protein
MSKIEITSSNIDKFVKRFHKIRESKDSSKKLSESQEIFAQSLGCNNYNELKKALEKEMSPTVIKSTMCNQIDLYKGIVIDNIDNLLTHEFIITLRNILKTKTDTMSQAELFYNQLLTLINHPKSKISSCIFKKDEFNYSFEFKSCYDDVFSYKFGDHPINEKNTTHHLAKINGFSPLDADLLKIAFSNNELVTNINLENRFEAIDFANDLYNYLKELRGVKNLYVLKFNEQDTVNKSYVYKHDLLYKKETKYIKKPEQNEISNLIADHEDNKYFYITNWYLLNSWSHGSEHFHYLKSLSNIDIIVEKADIEKLKG